MWNCPVAASGSGCGRSAAVSSSCGPPPARLRCWQGFSAGVSTSCPTDGPECPKFPSDLRRRRRGSLTCVTWVGIDLGGTKIYAVVFDGTDVLAEGKAKTPTQGGPLAVVDAMAAVVRSLGPVDDLSGVGVGAPG